MVQYTLLGTTPADQPVPEPTTPPPSGQSWHLVQVLQTTTQSSTQRSPVANVMLFWEAK